MFQEKGTSRSAVVSAVQALLSQTNAGQTDTNPKTDDISINPVSGCFLNLWTSDPQLQDYRHTHNRTV